MEITRYTENLTTLAIRYTIRKKVDSTYSRFVSVLADPPSPYENWATGLGITDPNADADSDGIANYLSLLLEQIQMYQMVTELVVLEVVRILPSPIQNVME